MKERIPNDPNHPKEIPNRENPDQSIPEKAPETPENQIDPIIEK